jgi:hypothetical protein
MRSFLHDGKRLIITAPYHENSTALSNGKNGALQHGDHNLSSLKNGNNTDDLKILGGASPTSSTRSIAGSVDSTFSNKR